MNKLQCETLYFECNAGISGDMVLGALLDLLQCEEYLRGELAKLGLESAYELCVQRAQRQDVAGTLATVRLTQQDHVHRHLRDIVGIIEQSGMEASAKDLTRRIFTTLAEAEAAVHGTSVDEVHFHEVGAIDAIVDICGSAILFSCIEAERIVCSPINVGSGKVQCAHGRLDVPAPATARILRDAETFVQGDEGEWTTPTGAAIARTVAQQFCSKDTVGMRCGVGIGQKDVSSHPNVLRVFV